MPDTILPPGGGEQVGRSPARRVTIRIAHELMVVTESRYAPGEHGPDLHVHHHHADCFRVLDGALTFEVGAERRRVEAKAGTFVLVPPDVAHTFLNAGSADATFLNFHAPGCAFDAHLRGDDERWDEHPPPAGGGGADAVVIRPPGEGETLELGGSEVVYQAQESDGIGSLAVMDMTLAPDFPGPVPHRHRAMVDSFHVLEGAIRVHLDGEDHELAAGGGAWVPPGVVHTFSNPGGEPARVLNVMAPAGLEQYLKDLAAAAGSGPPDPAEMARIAARYDFEPAA